MRRSADLDELAALSRWPARLLGIEPWQEGRRDRDKVLREYDREKYGPLLARLDRDSPTPGELQRMLESSWDAGDRLISKAGALYWMDRAEYEAERSAVYHDVIGPLVRDVGAVLDLGCGFGYKLWLLREATGARLIGGDIAPNAVRVAARVFATEPRIRVEPFDLLVSADYDRLFALAADVAEVTVFTCHSVEQLSSAGSFVDTLRRHRAKIRRVVHLEPATGLLRRESLLDLLRIGYARLNDYNQDLLETLTGDPEVIVERTEHDVLGANPLFPVSLLVWRFVQ